MPEIELRTSSADETRGVGAAIAALLVPGDVVSLTGDLGAGKTTLVQGAAGALGVSEPVTSPTFIIVREYAGELPVHHMDVYRLDRLQEVLDLGFEDLLDPQGVLFVEWGSAIEGLLPNDHLELELTGEEDDRHVRVRGRGRSWGARWDGLDAALGAWKAA
ncbi:MAG TPA: tRNA (adenosine(37)-N6)-threonylcarbamoyltransferase complex ATPase subunit type 1 TsaE [Actinomycetota bacterium]